MYATPIIREKEKALNKLETMRKQEHVSPMRYINWYCRFCCSHLEDGVHPLNCQRSSCIFGRCKKRMERVAGAYKKPDNDDYSDFENDQD